MAFEIHLMAPPGLEPVLADEARAAGFADPQVVPGGVTVRGGWPEVWRANLTLRGAGRVSARIGEFRAFHLAQLDKRARRFPWGEVLRPDVPVQVEVATNRKSKIYHAGAAQERIARAIHEELGAPLDGPDPVTVRARIDDNLVILSVDTSGEPLHKRGAKQAVGKAPLRETMAALLLRACGYEGREPVLDPFCGSGTFVLEAAEIAAGLAPGRARDFAFERLATFDPSAWQALRAARPAGLPDLRFHGSDRDAGAFAAARANAERAGVADLCLFEKRSVSEIVPPDGPPGLVIANPPYGTRIGEKKPLYGLYGALGATLRERFGGWRLGLVTSDASLARATGLDLTESAPIAHGGLRVRLYRSRVL
ncbi:THUMP domain-containing class I SAM-dependent RNA methyltransferase [Jannaschia formosa]|uniref:THUMP domain-containing class I SAM-dependent RNA methyltransferase n=1 Tax=Jannaschia formosa TaxID=2259592 RepID=UPI000E1B89B3|nr:class I SAM-dependent RNA methyltransferase [Jannaschia formosa]TFL17953.1 class I SAM-dependent RNA methyltransferase [Jannaschia formosa]